MNNKDIKYSIYLSEFQTFLIMETVSNPQFVLTDDIIIKFVDDKSKSYEDSKPNFVLNLQEKQYVINKIKTIHSVRQEEGCAILGDGEGHNYDWYNELYEQEDYNEYYWPRYKNYLLNKKHFPIQVVDRLENSTLRSLMSYIGDPNSRRAFSKRGLVIGDVQSGKTSNFMGLITKAADAGYKVIFVLTGTIENLRRQTQIRVEEGFIGYDSVEGKDVGVQRGEFTPTSFTSRQSDFIAGKDYNTQGKINNNKDAIPMIYVIKKNVSVLNRVYTSLKKINTTVAYDKINASLLVIDDEADNASINTNDEDTNPTKINGKIRDILNLFTKNTYVGFTATPFANVFINYDEENDMLNDDLFPKDFIYALTTPDNYCGSRKYFFEPNDNVKMILDNKDEYLPIKHKSNYIVKGLFNSVYEAINCFLLVNAIRDFRDIDIHTHRSMLINMSTYTLVQNQIKEIVEDYFEKIKRDVKQCSKLSLEVALTNESIKTLKNTFDKEYSNIKCGSHVITFKDIFENMYESISKIKINVVNSSRKSEKLDYEKNNDEGLRVIAIGGLALSRGLTLEGLVVSYFYRNTSTFDVLMQMGRWFGYRPNYEDLCKIFITPKSAKDYVDICTSIEQLKKDIYDMRAKGQRPTEYGIRVMNNSTTLQITAPNKRRNTSQKLDIKSYYGSLFETPYLINDINTNNENIDSTLKLLSYIKKDQLNSKYRHKYYENIEKEHIIELLDNIKIHKANSNFDVNQLNRFLKKKDSDLDYFDVLLMAGDSELKFNYEKLDLSINLVQRIFDRPYDEFVRINANRAHLWGRADTQNGLDKEIIKQIDKGKKAGALDYMRAHKRPLLIIYFIDLYKETTRNISEENKAEFQYIISHNKYNYMVGFAIGFPSKAGVSSKEDLYTVNNKVNYFDKDHGEEEIGDE